MEDFWLASAFQRNLLSLQSELCVESIVEVPAEHLPGEHVHDRHEEKKGFLQQDLGDVRGPHLIHIRELAEIHHAWETFGRIPWNRGAGFLVDPR